MDRGIRKQPGPAMKVLPSQKTLISWSSPKTSCRSFAGKSYVPSVLSAMSAHPGRLVPQLPVLRVLGVEVLTAVARLDPVPLQDVGDRGSTAITLVDLMHGQPGLPVLLRLALEDPLATVPAGVVPLALVHAEPLVLQTGLARLGEAHGDLAHLAEHRQAGVEEPLAVALHLPGPWGTRPVVLVEGLGVLLRQPVHLLVVGDGRGERRGVRELVQDPEDLVAHVVLLRDRLLDVPRRPDAVVLQVGEQAI